MFSNPATSIMSLEAAVRHDLGAMTVATHVQEGTGLSLARAVIVAVTQTVGSLQQSEEGAGSNSLLSSCEQGTLLQYISDSRKSPALLLLLLSCMKQLQHSCQSCAQGSLRVVTLAGVVSDLAVELFKLSTRSQVTYSAQTQAGPSGNRNSSARVSAASSSSASGRVQNSVLSSTATPSSSNTTDGEDSSLSLQPSEAAQVVPSTGTSHVASTWLLLFGRALYTTGVALQAVAAGAAPSSVPTMDVLSGEAIMIDLLCGPAPKSAASMLSSLSMGLQHYAGLASMFMESDGAASAVARRRQSGTVQVLLPGAGAANPAKEAYQTLGTLLIAAAQHAQELEVAAGAASMGELQFIAATHLTWRQVLSSEQGGQLPQALMNVGSLLCAVLPTKHCCNEPSCCCLDKPSELQLVGGKGTKCSGCGVARYCSVAHQRLHWKQHKPACKAIAAAAAASK